MVNLFQAIVVTVYICDLHREIYFENRTIFTLRDQEYEAFEG